jgi:hypothetical protein
MNSHVSFELAKLLKEKGFREPCQFLRVGGKYRINFEKEGDLFNNKYPSLQIPNDWYFAPTIAEVVMWLHEKHDIWIQVFILNKTFAWKATEITKGITWSLFAQQDKGDNSPTASYEAAIKYALKHFI